MARLVFAAADVRRVVEHSIAAPKQGEQLVDYDAKSGKPITKAVDAPAILLVHDQGVYIMSNGEPGDALDPTKAKEQSFSRFVAYAKGCNPATDPDWYETARDLVGGDDFGETLPWAQAIKAQLDRGAKSIAIKLTANNVSLVD